MKQFLSLLLLFCCFPLLAQSDKLIQKKDSLYAALRKSAPDTTRVSIYLNLSYAYAKINKDSILPLAIKARDLAKSLRYLRGEAEANRQIGKQYSLLGNSDLALSYLETAAQQFQQANYAQGTVATYIVFADYYEKKGKLESSKRYLTLAEQLSKKIRYFKGEANVVRRIGGLYLQQSKYDSAQVYHFKSLKIASKNKYFEGIALAQNHIAVVYDMQGNSTKALEYYQQALKTARANDLVSLQGTILNNIGIIYQNKGELLKALEYQNKALKIGEKLNFPQLVAHATSNISSIQTELQNTDKALELQSKAANINKELDEIGTLKDNLLDIALIHFKKKELKEAELTARKALEIAKQTNDLRTQSGVYELLANIEKDKGNFERALYYTDTFRTIRDSIHSIQKFKTTAELEAKYQNELKQTKINLLQKDNLLQQANIEQQSTLKQYFIIVLALLSVIVALLFNRYRLKSKSYFALQEQNDLLEAKNNEIQDKNKRIELLYDEMQHRFKNNLQLIESLMKLQAQQPQMDSNAQLILQESQNRIATISMLQQYLNQSNQHGQIKLVDYLTDIAEHLKISFQFDSIFSFHESEISVKSDKAIPIGLIVNELITNAIKYAFKSNTGQIFIRTALFTNEISLQINDTGSGFVPETGIGSGLMLVKGLSQQLRATMQIDTEQGSTFNFQIPI
ncbi:tetratricopeptide repeat protein [Flavobacterium sp.]|uniref:tetratricopeptide repeat protein n=1 Tax=Flavobacterium sp. TaxID=239 RepID=UPI00262E9682|nr:tetratricopeptide repeat protein [Flavobacterium sp.]